MNKGSIGIFINRVITASILFSLFLGGTPPKVVHAQGNIRYVTPGGLMEGECDSWVNACELQYALGIALAGDELWVAQGTYHPGAAGERESTFQLKTGVDIYGGFAGDEGSLEERDWLNNVVILSGDLNDNGIDDYDSYHVVKGADNAILDGVTVSGGNANGEVPNNLGAGMYNEYSNPSLNHVIFAGNTVVSGSGGGMYNRYSSPSLINVTFDGNSSDWFGGGLLNNASNPILSNTSFISNTAYYGGGITNFSNSSPSLTNVTFAGNIAEEGGGMNNRNSSPSLINVTFYGNTAEWGGGIANFESDFMMTNVTFSDNIAHYGGGMFNFTSMPSIINVTIVNNTAAMGGAIYNDDGSFSMIYNSIIWGNGDQFEGPPNARYSDIEVGEGEPPYPGEGNINDDPILGPLANNGGATMTRALLPGSPAINSGSNEYCPSYDQRGVVRPVLGICDMGAYEYDSDTPSAVDDVYTTDENTPLAVAAPGVLGNDLDVNGDVLTATLDSGPSHGLLNFDIDGSFIFTPTLNYNGDDSFSYHASDGVYNSNIATVNLIINSANDPPTAEDDNYSIDEDTPLVVDAPGVLDNDTDPDGDVLTATLDSNPAHGLLSFGVDGSFVYTPTLNYNGADFFTYRASDGWLNSNVATVYLSINPVNDPPIAADDSYTTGEDSPLLVDAPGILTNDTDVEGDELSAILENNPTYGELHLEEDGSFVYTPTLNYNGADLFTYRASDGLLNSDAVTVSLTINPVNDAPTAVDDSYTTDEDTPLFVDIHGVLENDTDPDGDVLTATLDSSPSHGLLSFDIDGSFAYTPTLNYNGDDSFSYHASDGWLNSNVATVYLSINPVNDPPIADDDNYTTEEDYPLFVAAPGVLENDADPDGDVITATLDSSPSHGLLSFAIDGSFVYTPTLNYNGEDSFTYHAGDGWSNSSVVTVSLTITPVNDPPIAADDNYTTDEDTPLAVVAPGILDNDADLEGDPLTAILESAPAHGLVVLDTDGSFVYTPTLDYNGDDTFTYHANDGELDSNTATVSLTINPINDVPNVEAGQNQDPNEGQQVAFTGSFTDPDWDGGVIQWDFGDGFTATGTLTPTHTYLDDGIYTVTLIITDSEGASGSDWLMASVSNVAPELAGLPDLSGDVGETFIISGVFTDPGVLDDHQVFIVWDSGITETIELAIGQRDFHASHLYAEAGYYLVTVTVNDNDGGESSQAFWINVAQAWIKMYMPVVRK